jgi:hypothetical protein
MTRVEYGNARLLGQCDRPPRPSAAGQLEQGTRQHDDITCLMLLVTGGS